ncbi:aminodeoxychorismate lyase [Paenibacillus radicis (ex Gao et al. 2016)]|uniref:4-amino-4-deoxychorismate lyase n=1 Tax=Paenibacillus radicis (ex Gao et al. 2016) TaxID=1737354 RepID=A0A917HQZ6_9BACL|nr:aminodeoxychorismate lyase [Paenibacillus radicis (ex Gao et al. 2016)]GGG87846.1 4-amino-4-deoxychorismate lyase [Paenibacillus radicis (ex Gao et al. 2016)]
MKIGFNGAVKKAEEAVISIYDHGFLYGMGLFETFRTYGGRPYLLERHLQRLAEGCEQLGIRYTADQEALQLLLAELLRENELNEAYIRLTVSAGTGELGLQTGDYERPSELLLMKALPPVSEALYRSGKELRLLSTARNTPEGAVRLKSLHYMNNMIAKRELAASGAAANAEGLMLTADGKLAEGIVSNLFYAKNGKVYTPSVDTGILPGITRAKVMELALEAGFEVEEGHFRYGELLAADEVWMTNSIQELVPITSISGCAVHGYDHDSITAAGKSQPQEVSQITVGDGAIGPITELLLQAYRSDTSSAS